MSHEYDDYPVTNEAIEAAVTLTVELRSRRQSASIEELATEAVELHIPHLCHRHPRDERA